LDGRVETLARWLEEEMAEDGTVSYECDGESADNAGSKQQSARDQAALRWLVRQGAAAAAETQAEVTNVGTEKAQAERSGRLWQEEEEEQIAAPEQQRWTSRWTRVPGCVAAVRLRTTIRAGAAPVLAEDAAEGLDASAGAAKPSDHDDDDGGDNDVVSVSASSSESAGRSRPYPAGTVAVVLSVEGTSDALVSRGLVMVVSRLLEGLDVEQVLAISKDHPSSGILTRLGLQRAVGPGRNDGFVGMIRTVQDHIREYHCQRGSEEDGRMQGEPVKSSLLVGRRRDSEEDGVDNKTTTITGDRRHELPSRSCRPLRRPRVALLLSGGVDSSVALHLLLRDGYDVSCYYLKIWLQDEMDHLGTCPWEDDYRTCQEVCRQAGDVPLHAVSLQNEYHARVVAHTVQQAEKGRTPNPDVLCNSRIKFGCFVDSVLNGRGNGEVARLGSGDDDPSPLRKYDYVASGHYAQIVRDGNGVAVRLHRAPDPVKDQSYFLCALRQDQLQQLLFPIGHLHKNQVRELAATFRLPNRSRPDSQGLCFLGKLKFDDFLRCYLGERPGPIVDAATGRRLGTHRGVWYHTVGQRRGIGPFLDPRATSLGPWYVVRNGRESEMRSNNGKAAAGGRPGARSSSTS
jgi:tRNA-specific 2-thiouridylase